MNESISSFLDQRVLAVAGVSGKDKPGTANFIFKKLRDAGYTVYPVNPRVQSVEGVICYPDVKSLPEPVGGVVIVTRPQSSETIVRDCCAAGITRVWMHGSFAASSVSPAAVEYCRSNGIDAIAGGCPMMHVKPVDFGHACMHWILKLFGKIPD
jgi:uncharacterized protein